MTVSSILGLEELKTAIFYRRLAAEAVGTAILIIFGCGAAMAVSPADALEPASISIAVAFGLAVATAIWCVGGVSGAHINPCVSVAMCVTCKIPVARCLAYTVVQCVGAIVGAALLWVVTPSQRRGTLGATLLAEEVSQWQGFLVEVLATFVLVLTIFASTDPLQAGHHSGGSVALSIGLVVTMDIPWAIQYTGASMNPARSFGPSVVAGLWDDHWVFWIGPIVGALVAATLYELVFHQRHFRSSATAPSDVSSPDTEAARGSGSGVDGSSATQIPKDARGSQEIGRPG